MWWCGTIWNRGARGTLGRIGRTVHSTQQRKTMIGGMHARLGERTRQGAKHRHIGLRRLWRPILVCATVGRTHSCCLMVTSLASDGLLDGTSRLGCIRPKTKNKKQAQTKGHKPAHLSSGGRKKTAAISAIVAPSPPFVRS
jgi:hypothetical protein